MTMLSLLNGLVSAQIVLDKPIKKSIVQNDVRLKTQVSAAKYNGAVVGYALACKLDENKIRIVQDEFKNEDISTVDGVKIDFADNWVHLRKSNTEPIIRIYTEAFSQEEADKLGDDMIAKIRSLI